ncbi:MAG: response regulator [Deltaproteobacteria bacterium]|nr:response regulator [Deltaproteobacteria bacterium]
MDFKPKKILFVDCREAYRNIFSELLCEAGYDVEASSGANDALEKVKKTPYDLVITDIGSLGFDGIDLYLDTIAEKPEMGDGFLFITGGHAEDTKMREVLTKLNKKFIIRPFGINELLRKISAATGQERDSAPGFRERFENRRQEKRFKWEEDCLLTQNGETNNIPLASTVDISRNGVKIRYLGAPIKPESLLEVDVRHIKVKGPAAVAWSTPVDDMEAISGLRFLEPINVSSILTVIQSGRWRTTTS